MGFHKRVNEEDLLFSCLYGNGIYSLTDEAVQDPLGGDNGEGRVSPLIRNILTEEQYYVKMMDCTDQMYERFRNRILHPPCRDRILWPSDMIDLRGKNIACTMFVSQEYTDTPTPVSQRAANVGFLFPYGGYPQMVNGVRRLSQIRQPSWKNQAVQRIAYRIVEAIDAVNRSGYVYGDIHLSRFFFLQDDTVYLNFSNLVFSMRDLFSEEAAKICAVHEKEYPLEFADPAVYRGLCDTLDFQAQNYSLTALLFYLFIGQYPYDGRLLSGYTDDSEQSHYIKFRDYLKMPVFIFDPDDKQNALGAFTEDEQVVDLWNELPEQLRILFVTTLRKANAERTKTTDNPTPGVWLQYFRDLGWHKSLEVS